MDTSIAKTSAINEIFSLSIVIWMVKDCSVFAQVIETMGSDDNDGRRMAKCVMTDDGTTYKIYENIYGGWTCDFKWLCQYDS